MTGRFLPQFLRQLGGGSHCRIPSERVGRQTDPLSRIGGTTMSSVQVRTAEKLVNVWQAAIATLATLAEQVKRGNVNGQLGEVQALLEALPLSSGDFSRVSNNLKNAERYLQSNECGAAAYELRLLTGAVRICLLAEGNMTRRLKKTPL